MADDGRVPAEPHSRARAASILAAPPRRLGRERLTPARFIPSGRSLGLALLIVVGAWLAWIGARDTGVFAVRTISVAGAPPTLAKQVRRSLADTRGRSLLKIDLDAARQKVEKLPAVESARFDRSFPHILRVVIVPERPVAVVRQGADSYLVAASGRVVAAVGRHDRPRLARIWVDRTVSLVTGGSAQGDLRTAVSAVAPLAGSLFPGRVTSVTTTSDALTLRLRSGLELRLGDPRDVPLKLAIAARVIPLLDPGTVYLDVAVPERPVAGTLNSQVEVKTPPSTTP